MAIAPAAQRGQSVLNGNQYFALATVDTNGPWTACLAYTLGPPACLYFFSERTSRHGVALLSGGRVAGVIFDSHCTPDTAESLQFSGYGELAHDEASIRYVLEAGAKHTGGTLPTDDDIRDTLNKPNTALFRITVEDAYVLDQTLFATEGIDGRQPVAVSEVFAPE